MEIHRDSWGFTKMHRDSQECTEIHRDLRIHRDFERFKGFSEILVDVWRFWQIARIHGDSQKDFGRLQGFQGISGDYRYSWRFTEIHKDSHGSMESLGDCKES